MAGLPNPENRQCFEIALLCALPLEGDAVESVLDEKFEAYRDGAPIDKATNDHNAYTLGRLGSHYVVVVYMPGMGKASSAGVSSGLRSSFSNIKLAVVVGICGGVPELSDGSEILLGDVVVSTSIVQIDFGRLYPNKFERRNTIEDNPGKSSPEIRAFLSKLLGPQVRQRLMDRTNIYLQNMESNVSYPGSANDKLYPASYLHRHHLPGSCTVCQGSDDEICETAMASSCRNLGCDERLVVRRTRHQAPWKPFVHFGRIGSGDFVLKSGEHRDKIAAQENLTAFEMEGAGVWDHLPTVIVKSACDYADSHKNKAWQGYCAQAAAACVKGMLEVWRKTETPSFAIRSSEAISRSASTHPDIRSEMAAKEREGLALRTLCYAGMDSRRDEIKWAYEKTCDWLFENSKFRRWIQREDVHTHNGVLWIKGKPGVGKSTLMKHALSYCKSFKRKPVIASYFFHARGGPMEKSRIGMLQYLSYQLLDQLHQFQESHFLPIYLENEKKHGENWEWHPNVLEQLIKTILVQTPRQRIFLFIDALDECSETEVRTVVAMLEDFSRATTRSGSLVNICLSSRHYPSIRLMKVLELTVEKQLEHNKDIERYIQDSLHVPDDDTRAELLWKSEGVFMWVILVIQLLNQQADEGRPGSVWKKRTLQEIPSDLDEVFLMLLEKDNPRKDQTVFALQLVLFGGVSLTLEELYLAILASTEVADAEDSEPWYCSEATADSMERFIITVSRGLVEVSQTSGYHRMQFIHETVNDFLTRHGRLQSLDPTLAVNVVGLSHDRIVECCLHYLRKVLPGVQKVLMDNEVKNILSDDILQDILLDLCSKYRFLSYACGMVFHHMNEAHLSGLSQWERLTEVNSEPKMLVVLQRFGCSFDAADVRRLKDITLLQMASIYLSPSLVKLILDNLGAEVNQQSGHYGTALQAACYAPSHECVKILLKAGAEINVLSGTYGTALQAACYNGRLELVKVLLEAGAEVNVSAGKYGTALQAACYIGRLKLVKVLLEAGADVNAQGG